MLGQLVALCRFIQKLVSNQLLQHRTEGLFNGSAELLYKVPASHTLQQPEPYHHKVLHSLLPCDGIGGEPWQPGFAGFDIRTDALQVHMPLRVGITMRPRTQPVIGPVPPIHGVVAAFEARLGEIADFVLPEALLLQPAHDDPEHLRLRFLLGQEQLVLHIKAVEQRVLLHLQTVDGIMLQG
ncbi:hypothetical protein D3C81_1736540 [compost metagenome]